MLYYMTPRNERIPVEIIDTDLARSRVLVRATDGTRPFTSYGVGPATYAEERAWVSAARVFVETEPSTLSDCVALISGTHTFPDPRIARREQILAALQSDPLTTTEGLEYLDELAEIDQSLSSDPCDALQERMRVGWKYIQPIEF